MLYEVITQQEEMFLATWIRDIGYYRANNIKYTLTSAQESAIMGFRITSYNVCYTKLLRPFMILVTPFIKHKHNLMVMVFHIVNTVRNLYKRQSRITSYNVCYTKLLRLQRCTCSLGCAATQSGYQLV